MPFVFGSFAKRQRAQLAAPTTKTDVMARQGRQDAAYLRTLPFDQRLARMTLSSINPGPDGVESMRQCQCDTAVYEVKEHM